ncbi:MerR family transcriptional regulator [Leifsonia sp. TF02-11]|uniref:MerR family transcriptional regulator n=1 Tax=Leifsonia sp. TF02-11 TaxID=2815212 RepID=UPI001AA0CC18|nr:MerR family transcriptional regulator [Leifsonia sp. TF02-11]MBO1739203.1 MerR family transcriptional regulator [Leifsonia sp. TF02-11]
MKIGELSRRTGVSTRMLRYYEAQGLLRPERESNGYRTYTDESVERAKTIGSLIRSGLTTRLVELVLSTEDGTGRWTADCDREFVGILSDELAAIEDKIACLSRSRDAVRAVLATR